MPGERRSFRPKEKEKIIERGRDLWDYFGGLVVGSGPSGGCWE